MREKDYTLKISQHLEQKSLTTGNETLNEIAAESLRKKG